MPFSTAKSRRRSTSVSRIATFGLPGNARVAGCAVNLFNLRRARQRIDNGVFAAAAADNQNLHRNKMKFPPLSCCQSMYSRRSAVFYKSDHPKPSSGGRAGDRKYVKNQC